MNALRAVMIVLAVLTGCERSQTQSAPDLGSPTGGIGGVRKAVYCGRNGECDPARPYCCKSGPFATDFECRASAADCVVFQACTSNGDCPSDYRYCCTDDPARIDCRKTCDKSLCVSGGSKDCFPDKPFCDRSDVPICVKQ